MTQILNKTAMYDLLDSGSLGNTLPMWRTVEEVRESGYTGPVGLRIRRGSGGGRHEYNIPFACLAERIDAWVRDGIARDSIIIQQMAPHTEHGLINGEVIRTPLGLELFYSRVRLPMKEALAVEHERVVGIRALTILRYFLDGSSLDDLMELMDLWPTSAIEFSAFDIPLGIRHRNTIIWEVRDY